MALLASSTTAPATTSASTNAACAANLYDIPTTQPACAVPFSNNTHTSAMASCCRSADVVSYSHDCGLYCLAEDQSVQALIDCLYKAGLAYQDVFCNSNTSSTATATQGAAAAATSAGVSVVVTGGGGADGGSGGGTMTSGGGFSIATSSSSSDAVARALLGTGAGSGLGALWVVVGALLQIPAWFL